MKSTYAFLCLMLDALVRVISHMMFTNQLIGCKNGVALKMTSSKPPAEPLPVETLTDFSSCIRPLFIMNRVLTHF